MVEGPQSRQSSVPSLLTRTVVTGKGSVAVAYVTVDHGKMKFAGTGRDHGYDYDRLRLDMVVEDLKQSDCMRSQCILEGFNEVLVLRSMFVEKKVK
jgi:hypothetical protein